jgi:uncharacterized delta-60 repeat protein
MSRPVCLVGLAFLLLLTAVATALAATGDPDPSFDGDGVATVDFSGSDSAEDLVIQPDGKIVVAGDGTVGQDFAAARLNLDGSLDTGFGGDGKTTANFGARDNGYSVALQPDGKVVMAGGMTVGENRNFAIVRLTADGSPDPTFSGDGLRPIDYGGRDEAEDVLVQPDGQIVVAGSIFGIEFAVTRLNPDGEIEDGFGTVSVNFTGTDTDRGYAVALQPDGKVVVAGSATTGTNSDIAVARITADGTLDASFDGDGRRTIDLGGGDRAEDVLVQPDGKIVLTGVGLVNHQIAVVRLNPDGSLDAGFDGDGVASADAGDTGTGNAAALQANGKIVVAASGGGQPHLLRFQPGGALDTTFSGDGRQTLPVPGGAFAVALLRDGRIATAGGSAGNFFVAVVEGDSGDGAGPGGGPGAGTTKVQRCAGKKATIVGTNKANRLKGTRRADVIVALGGNDRIDGAGGNDLICAGAGNDSVKGSKGNDRLYGQDGKDKLDGGNGNDALGGDAGKDALVGGAGKDRLSGGGGKDSCAGGAGKDRATCERQRGI